MLPLIRLHAAISLLPHQSEAIDHDFVVLGFFELLDFFEVQQQPS